MKSFGNVIKDNQKRQSRGELREEEADPLACLHQVGSKP